MAPATTTAATMRATPAISVLARAPTPPPLPERILTITIRPGRVRGRAPGASLARALRGPYASVTRPRGRAGACGRAFRARGGRRRTAALHERACHHARFLAVIRGVPRTMACSAVWGGTDPPAQPGVTAPCRRALDAISRDQLPEPASTRPRRALVVARSRTSSRFGCGRALIMKVCAVAPTIRRNRPGGPPAAIRHSPPQAHGFAPDFVRSARDNARGTSVRRVPGAASARQRGTARRPAYPSSAITRRLAARYSSVSSKLSLATRFTGTMPATWLGSPAAGAPAST